MPNHNDEDNVTNLKDFKKRPTPKRNLNGASAGYSKPASSWNTGWRRKTVTVIQFIFVAGLSFYFMQTCSSIFPH